MERKEKFLVGERYHLFTRGVEKRRIFKNGRDYDRFLLLLFLANNNKKIHMENLLKRYKGEPFIQIFTADRGEMIVHIEAYALMPNHVHILVHEKRDGGISKFMLKLMTAYAMYFNAKYERSGPLFTRPFRSKHINTDEYFRWVFSYVNLNPIELFQNGWRETGIRDPDQARKFMRSYPYSSFRDYFAGERAESCILHKAQEIQDNVRSFDEFIAFLAVQQYQGEPFI